MDIYRIRVRLDDAPGRLGAAAAALGAFGINIIDVDVHTIDAATSADDLLIEITKPVDLPLVEHTLREADCDLQFLEPVDPHDVGDALTHALELGLRVAREGGSADVVTRAAAELVRADHTWIEPSTAGAATPGETRRGPAQRRDDRDGGPSYVLSVPFVGAEGEPLVLFLIRDRLRFSFTETARVQALLRFAAVATSGHH